MKTEKFIKNSILQSSELIRNLTGISHHIEKTAEIIIKSIRQGNKLILFGNGGSATDAQHIAAEFIGRFNKNRKSFPAIALTADSAIMTSLSNDYDFDFVFSRQCESLVSPGDVALGISTSGNSENVRKGLIAAKKNGATTIGLLGNKGGRIKKHVDIAILVPSSSTSKIQEAHRIIYHIICELTEKNLAKKI